MSDRLVVKPSLFILYGFRGDLTKKKILPGLIRLEEMGMLPDNFFIYGTSRHKLSAEQTYNVINECADGTCSEEVLKKFHSRIQMAQLDITKTDDFHALAKRLDTFEKEKGLCFDIIHYLALPPDLFTPAIENIGHGELNTGCSEEAGVKVLIEKPFGNDLESAIALQQLLHGHVGEEQIFLVDHYLAKEPVENILYFIRNNPMLADIWNSTYIRRMEIMASETDGVEGRKDFYDKVGALRDMFQSHLLEVLALLTLRHPDSTDHTELQKARLEVLKHVKPFTFENSVRGQYVGYRVDVDNPASTTETFATVTTEIDMPGWHSTQFVLSSGKKLDKKQTTAKVYFAADTGKLPTPNILTFEFFPDHGVKLGMNMKEPGSARLHYAELAYDFPKKDQGLEGYQTIILAALTGDRTVFSSTEEAIANWHTLQPLLDEWAKKGDDLVFYEQGKELT